MTGVDVGVLLLLGAVHGVNPAMGWLFAVSLGLQEQRRGAVWAALVPLAAGHAAAIAVVVALAVWLGRWLPLEAMKAMTAAALLGFGLLHLTRHLHPRLAGMRVGPRAIAAWSFLMATAHGAGLMVLPFLPGPPEQAAAHAHAGHAAHAVEAGAAYGVGAASAVAIVHTLGYLLAAGGLAATIYEKLGLRLLRKAWVNINAVWAAALIATAAVTLIW